MRSRRATNDHFHLAHRQGPRTPHWSISRSYPSCGPARSLRQVEQRPSDSRIGHRPPEENPMTKSESPETSAGKAESVTGNDIKPRRLLGPWFFGALAVAVVLSGLLAYSAIRNRAPQGAPGYLRVTGIPADVPTSIANLMALSPVQHSSAPNFTLVDQLGKKMSLTSLRGRTVVLEFMDPHCIDICPIVSQEFVDAYHDLGTDASHVVFVAVNVNPYFTTVADMRNFSYEHRVNATPSWHFLSGAPSALKAVWPNYGI